MAYTADDYAAWIVKNADKKGTPEFDTVAKAYKLAKLEEKNQTKPVSEPFEVPGVTETALIGVGRGLRTLGAAVGAVEPESTFEAQALEQLGKERPIALTIGEAVGESIPGMIAAGPVGAIEGAAARIAATAGIGGIEGALIGKGRGEDVAQSAALGAALGGAGETAMVGAKAFWPRISEFGTALYQKLTGKAPTEAVLNAAGEPSAEMVEALGKVGSDFNEMVKEASQEVGAAAKTRVGREAASGRIAAEVKPSEAVLKAAEALGIKDKLLPSHYATNPVYVAVEQGLKSIPGSQLALQEKGVIAELAQKADDLIVEFGGTIDKSELSERFRSQTMDVIAALENEAKKAYDAVRLSVPDTAEAQADKALAYLAEKAQKLGGEKYLDATEKRLLKDLAPDTNPTYARLDAIRKDLLAGSRGQGPFKDSEASKLNRLYGLLLEDQKAVAESFGAKDLYETASNLVKTRKIIEDQLQSVTGKEVTKDITAKAGSALLDLAKGKAEAFRKLQEGIPKEVGADMRREVFVTALNDVFTAGARNAGQLNVPGFSAFMDKLARNKEARRLLAAEIGEEAMTRLNNLHLVAGGIAKAQAEAVRTGLIQAVPGMVDEVNYLAAKLYGAAKGAASILPGVRHVVEAGETVAKRGGTRSQAADKLLASPEFRQIVVKQAAGKIDTPAKRATANKVMERLPAFREWVKHLPDEDITRIINQGAIAYLVGSEDARK